MPVEKILGNIRKQLNEIAPLLEDFSDQTVQPGVEACAALQKKINELQELLAVYRHSKQNYEVSPSFSLHAHISEAAEMIKQEAALPAGTAQPHSTEDRKETTPREPDVTDRNAVRPLQVGLNDKFRFINELFAHNDAEYNIAIEQLKNLQSWSETDLYLNSLKNLYGWRDDQDSVKYFYSLVKKRFQ